MTAVPGRMSEEFRRLDDELAGAVGLPSVDAVIRRTGMLNRASTAAAAAVITVGALGGLTAVAQASVGRPSPAAVVAAAGPSTTAPSSIVVTTPAPPVTTAAPVPVAPVTVAPISAAPVVHATTRARVYSTYRRRPTSVVPTRVVAPPPPSVVTTTKAAPPARSGGGDEDPPTTTTGPVAKPHAPTTDQHGSATTH